ncbi:unnamed protein product [Ranitomeya imitator]|uniref:Krueppel-like factor 12 n=1 Tax=Ranitomeya imitator TaxID=111125 RepID=A0ABN9LIZ4_9NEOB|nr:unnamed protein product [Ranitomeya imitator]
MHANTANCGVKAPWAGVTLANPIGCEMLMTLSFSSAASVIRVSVLCAPSLSRIRELEHSCRGDGEILDSINKVDGAVRSSPKVHSYQDMEAVPLLLNNVKAEPPEDLLATDHFQTQTEPVDLSINKARSSPRGLSSSPLFITTSVASPSSNSSSSRPASSPTVITTVPSTASVPTVLTPGPLVASASGVGGQQFLHIIHPVPSSSPMNLQSTKLSHVHRIPVVVQSVPVVYTAVRSPGSMNSTIVVPFLEDGRSHLKAAVEPAQQRRQSQRLAQADTGRLVTTVLPGSAFVASTGQRRAGISGTKSCFSPSEHAQGSVILSLLNRRTTSSTLPSVSSPIPCRL